MKFLIVFVALFAVAFVDALPEAYIENLESEVGPESYSFNFKTSDGQQGEAKGVLNNVGSDHESLAVKGSFSYVGDDGKTYEVTYIADENGFQPQGAHLPVAP
ncbi:larval cuticle protein 65Ag1-like [Drosophila biarmipes]|uniref:larval cuticle protein 65Ag1-like n=1 Tax=Drosophila biarmipes TaxID=125945 RepID=UPI0007E7046B|nr:larval cuticle protein 65Ag1-like [Drosophila biarmipes]